MVTQTALPPWAVAGGGTDPHLTRRRHKPQRRPSASGLGGGFRLSEQAAELSAIRVMPALTLGALGCRNDATGDDRTFPRTCSESITFQEPRLARYLHCPGALHDCRIGVATIFDRIQYGQGRGRNIGIYDQNRSADRAARYSKGRYGSAEHRRSNRRSISEYSRHDIRLHHDRGARDLGYRWACGQRALPPSQCARAIHRDFTTKQRTCTTSTTSADGIRAAGWQFRRGKR